MTPSEQLALAPATRQDLAEVADLFIAARAAAEPAMPPLTDPPARVRRTVLGWDLAEPGREVWVCRDAAGRLLGFVLLRGAWLDDLYVAPGAQRSGVGSALLEAAMGLRPTGFCLWVFASNLPARAFYARHGLVELESTDGSGNAERSPDVRMAWPGRDPVAFLRGLVDDVDDELGDLLARRVALTRVIQAQKGEGEGPAPRDGSRERQVARRIAARAPELGETGVARIVDVLVEESLAAVRGPGGSPDRGPDRPSG